MNVLKRLRPSQPDKTQLNGSDRRSIPPFNVLSLLSIVLGFLGLTINSIFAGSATHHGLMFCLSQGVRGVFVGVVTIAIAVLSALAGCGAMLLPRKIVTASRLMAIAALMSIGLGGWLGFLGIKLMPLAIIASACLTVAAILSLLERFLRVAKGEKLRG